MDTPPLQFQLADRNRFSNELADAGLTDVRVDSSTWEMTFPSADHFWAAVTASNPIAVQLTAHLTDEQRAEVKQVIHGMLRERSVGAPHAVLCNEMNIGIGRKP
jgi:hypothetical protein